MTTNKSTHSRRKASKGFDLKPFILLYGLLLLIIAIIVGFQIHTSGRRLIPLSVIALILGVIFEGKRIYEKWLTVFWTAGVSFILSFMVFLPGKREQFYSIEDHIEIWPYAFIFIFIILAIGFHGDKIMPKLTEGITLLQSIAVIYWIADYNLFETRNLFFSSIMIIGLLFSAYSLFHAFTNTVLTRTSRLTLSIWSSLIMILFAVDNIYRVYQNEQIENTEYLIDGFYIGLQFFLLGISSIYIVQNFGMIMGFLPGKGTFFNAEYFRDLKELKNDHVTRYSNKQVSTIHSLFCILFTGSIFVLNFYYRIVPRNIAIWIVFLIFPFVLILYDYVTRKKNYS